jgi:hypothetical protein
MHVREGQPPPFKPEDVVLQNGDLVLVEARGTERGQTGSAEVEPSRFGGAPPTMSLAVAMPDGRVLVQVSAAPAATSTAAATGQWQTFGASQFQAFETDGRPIDAKALADRLQKMTAVLVATDGRRPDALYLQAIKPGTPVLVIQSPVAPRPG